MTTSILREATPEMASEYRSWFVNRSAYTRQSDRPHRESGRHYYYRPHAGGRAGSRLTAEIIRRHLEGNLTVGLYSINPKNQRVKWVAIDADYRSALEDLLKLQYELKQDGVQAALEQSRRGGHLWVLFDSPVLAREARIYVRHLAERLSVEVKGSGLTEGIELFPKQDRLREGEFGNAIRGPLGVHRAADRRYWFYGAPYDLGPQFGYLRGLRRMTESKLRSLIRELPVETESEPRRVEPFQGSVNGRCFRILDYVEPRRKVGRNWVAQCPSCAAEGHDTSKDNLAISIEEPQKYICWAGCSREMIRAALGAPPPVRS